MALFGRPAAATIAVTPSVVLPRESVHANVTTSKPIEQVTSARIELGYTNFYRYRWAGRADAAATQATDSLWLVEEVGTNYGTDRDTDDWVGVLSAELPIATGRFSGGSATFRVPSWAPGSSKDVARWSCRLVVERNGRDIDEHGEFTVVVGKANAPSDIGGQERISGKGAAEIEITLPGRVFRAGEQVSGNVDIRPTCDLPDGDVRVCLQRYRYSHPLLRTPGETTVAETGHVQLGKGIPLRAGEPVRLPFTLSLPGDAAPSATGVHSSVAWFVHVQMFYAGWSGPPSDKVRRGIAVVNAP